MATWTRLPDRAVLVVGGADRFAFLQGLVSNDLAKLASQPAIWAALLTPQGKYLFDFFIVVDGERYLLDVEATRRQALLQRLTLYRLRAAVELAVADEFGVFACFGSASALTTPPSGALAFADPRTAELGARVLGPPAPTGDWLATFGAEVAPTDYDAHRLAVAVPDGSRDLEPDKALLLENGFAELDGVAFDKGCFVGQELTARMRYRATVRKRLLPVLIDGTAAPGTPITDGQVDIGELRSARDGRALALIRIDRWQKARDAGRPLQAETATVEPWIPSWLDLSFASRREDSSA